MVMSFRMTAVIVTLDGFSATLSLWYTTFLSGLKVHVTSAGVPEHDPHQMIITPAMAWQNINW